MFAIMPDQLGHVSAHVFGHGVTKNLKNLGLIPGVQLETFSDMPADSSGKQNVVMFSRNLVECVASLTLDRASCQTGRTETKSLLHEPASKFCSNWGDLDSSELSQSQKCDNSAVCIEHSFVRVEHGIQKLPANIDVSQNIAATDTSNCDVNCNINTYYSADGSGPDNPYNTVTSDRVTQVDDSDTQGKEYNEDVDNCGNDKDWSVTLSDNTHLTHDIDSEPNDSRCEIDGSRPFEIRIPFICDTDSGGVTSSTGPGRVRSAAILELLDCTDGSTFCSLRTAVGKSCGDRSVCAEVVSVAGMGKGDVEVKEMDPSDKSGPSARDNKQQKSLDISQPEEIISDKCNISETSNRQQKSPDISQEILLPEEMSLYKCNMLETSKRRQNSPDIRQEIVYPEEMSPDKGNISEAINRRQKSPDISPEIVQPGEMSAGHVSFSEINSQRQNSTDIGSESLQPVDMGPSGIGSMSEVNSQRQNSTDIGSESLQPADVGLSDSGSISETNSQRQGPLEPDSGQIQQSLVKSKNSHPLQRSRSYPHMTQRELFTPIRPSPEESGLFAPPDLDYSTNSQIVSSPVHEVTRNGDSAQVLNYLASTPKGHTKHQSSNPPVARVNPLANLNPPVPQQHYLEHEPQRDAQIQQSHVYCPHMLAVQSGYFVSDIGGPCQPAIIPVFLVADPTGSCYLTSDYIPDTPLLAPTGVEHLVQYPLPVGESHNRTFSQNRAGVQNKPPREVSSVRTQARPCVQTNNHKEACKSSRRSYNQISGSSSMPVSPPDRRHKTSTSQSFLKRRHKKPLLPDPLIPKFSELASLAENPGPNFATPGGDVQEYSHPSYYFQPSSNDASVFHPNSASSSVFLHQVPCAVGGFTSPVISAAPLPLPVGSLTSNHQQPEGHIPRATDSSESSDSGDPAAGNHAGVETCLPQSYCPRESPSLPTSPVKSPTSYSSPPTNCHHHPEVNLSNTPPTGQGLEHHHHHLQGEIIYIPDGSGSFVAIDAAAAQHRVEHVVFSGYPQQDPPPCLLSSRLSQEPQPEAEIAPELQAEAVDLRNSPATVRMVSSSGPPLPMPMQVPPGHMVQQIVDEHGILTHVILSPQLPGPGGHLPVGPFAGHGSGSQYYTHYGGPSHYPHGPAQYLHRSHGHPGHVHGAMAHPVSPQSSSSCPNHSPLQAPGEYGSSPPLNSRDERTMRMRNRVRKKLQQRRGTNEGFCPGNRAQTGRRSRGNSDEGLHAESLLTQGHSNLSEESEPLDMEVESSVLIQCLSSMPAPKVTDVDVRSGLIQLSSPDCDCPEVDLDSYEIKYELLLSDKGRDAKYKTVFCGDASEITLKDLKPATEYHLKVCAMLTEELKGALTEPVSFQTLPCEPDTPQPPKLISKTRTSLLLKWNATCENGSKITAYSLESDQGQADGQFKEVYSGLQRQFKVQQLSASTRYRFRLAAANSHGKSAYSEEASFYTSGSAPSQPDPPMLSEQFVYALTISWIRRPSDEEFLLQMEDETTGHGFITVYNGANLSTVIKNLRRNTEYKFRLGAKNEEGQSKWSEVVSYKTHPDRPHAPSKPQIKGKMSPYSFRVTWDPPQDTGGSDITKYILELDNGQGYDTVYQGCEREYQFDHLLPGTLYHVRVACCSAGGKSDFSPACAATTLPVFPGQCQVPKLQGKPKATSLHLRWSYPDYDGGAQVTHFSAQMISPDNSAREVYKGHDRDCIVAGLLPGRPYLFQVRAFNRVGAGPWSEPLEVVSGAGVPDPPRIPQVTCRSAHSALVTWEEPFNNGASISEYRLEWQHPLDASEFSQLYLGPNLFYEAKGLAAATTFMFRVQAINAAGPGPFSDEATWTTPASNPSPVLTVKVKANATSALVSWGEPNCNGSEISSYNIAVNDWPPVTVGPVTEHLLEDLQSESSYKVRVQAMNSVGVGAYSSPVKFTTKAQPPSPPVLECVLSAASSVKLKWGDGRNSDHLTYTLEMAREDGSFQAVYIGPAHTHKVTRLAELSSYRFRTCASNDAGSGPYSDTYTFTTTKAAPPSLKAPRVTNLTLHGCLLDWQGVKPMGGDSIVYIVQLLCVSDRSAEYKQIYKGPDTQYQLSSLLPEHEYQARVAAIRVSPDHTADIAGAFSPGVIFSPQTAEPQRTTPNPVTGQEERSEEKKPWSDQQFAAMILCMFVLLAVMSAFLCQQLISYMSSPEDPASSTPLRAKNSAET